MPEESNVELQYQQFQEIVSYLRRLQSALSSLKVRFTGLSFQQLEELQEEIVKLKNIAIEYIIQQHEDDDASRDRLRNDLASRTLTDVLRLALIDINSSITKLSASEIKITAQEIENSANVLREATDNVEDTVTRLENLKKGFKIAGAIFGIMSAVSASVASGNFGGVISSAGNLIAVLEEEA
ncbi:MAG: hypothetical protein WBD99_16305 [Thermodesulfobacteriota bacterium]